MVVIQMRYFIKTVLKAVALIFHDVNEVLEDYGEEKAKRLRSEKFKMKV